MRLLRVALLAWAAMAIVFACTPFDADGDQVQPKLDGGPGGTSSSSSSSSGALPAEAGAGADAGECFDFHDSVTNGFEARGTPKPTTDGYQVVVNSTSTYNSIRKTFNRPSPIQTSKVTLDVKIEASEAFNADEYADTLTLYYGLPANYGASPETPLTQFEAVAGGDVDVNMWNQSGGGGYSYFKLTHDKIAYGTKDGLVVVETRWQDPGQHLVSSGTSTVKIDASLANAPKNDLTVEIGGRQGDPGDPPEVTLTLRRLCVEIH